MSSNLIDPKDYKHVKSDEHSTTLQHKRGHIVTIAHNAVSPQNREMLKSMANHKSDNSPQYGQVVKKFAEGGDTERLKKVTEKQTEVAQKKHPGKSSAEQAEIAKKWKSQDQFMRNTAGTGKVVKYAEGTTSVQPKVVLAGQTNDTPPPSPPKEEHPVGSNIGGASSLQEAWKRLSNPMAHGGKVDKNKHVTGVHLSEDDSGTSFAGRMQREGYHKSNIKEIHETVRDINKNYINPNIKGLAQGGKLEHEMPTMYYAKGGGIDAEVKALPDWFHAAGDPQKHSNQLGQSEANYAYDAHLPCLNPHCKSQGKPHPNCRCYTSGEQFAGGGEVTRLRYCARGEEHVESCEYAKGGDVLASGDKKGISEQGADIRMSNAVKKGGGSGKLSMDYAKDEAKGRASMERHTKPKMKGLAEGGNVNRHMYADQDEPVSTNDSAPHESMVDTEKRLRKDANAADHYREAARLAEKAGDASQPQGNTQPIISDFNNIGGQAPSQQSAMPQQGQPAMQGQLPSDEDDNANTPAIEGPNQIDHENDHYGNPAQLDQSPQPQSDMQAAGLPQQPQVQPQQPGTTIPQTQMAPQVPPPLFSAQDHIAENQAWQQDLNNGHITPKTYNDLMFHNKDGSDKSTLGKIGSIFGLMVSGAGAGLAHQQNMAMQMMDNVIKNDLEAQKTSKADAQNFIHLNQQRLLNDANVQNILQSANYTQAQKQAVIQGIQMKAYTQSYMDIASTVFHDQMEKLKKLQPGTQAYQDTAKALMLMSSKIDQNNAQAAVLGQAGTDAMGMYGLGSEAQGAPQGQGAQLSPEQKFQNDMQVRENSGDKAGADALRARHIPGIPGFATKDIPEDKRDKLTAMSVLDDKVKDVLNFAQQHRGSVDPRTLAQAKQKAEELTSFYNKSVDSLGMTQGRLGWLEKQIKTNPTSLIEQLLGNNSTLREIRDSNSHRKDIELNRLGFPVQPKAQGQTTATEGQTGTFNGKPVVFKAGKWTLQ